MPWPRVSDRTSRSRVLLRGFIDDPPDSHYQRGFLAGLRVQFVMMQTSIQCSLTETLRR